ncbi:MAG: CotH kinase family protein [Pirellulales bacterium]
MDFDGVNDFVTTPATAASLDIAADSQRTIAAWVKGPASGQGTNGAVFEVGTAAGEFAVRTTSTAGNTWSVEQGNEALGYTESAANIWYHLAVVYDGAATIVYVNGLERIRNDNPDLDTGGAGTFNLGKRTATNLFFRGAVDDLAVWDMPLSGSAIASLAAATTTPLAVKTVNRPLGSTLAGYDVRHVIASATFPGQVTGEIGGNAGSGANALADADALLALPPGHAGIAREFSFQYDQINFRDPDGGGGIGLFSGDEGYPIEVEEVDENHFAVRATATLVVPAGAAGEFVFGIHSDEGARLRIDGANVILDNTIDGANLNTATITLAEGEHTLELVHFERLGGAELELLYKSRSNGFDNGDFQLLSIVPDQQLPPPPITVYDAPPVYFPIPTPGAANNVGVEVFVGPTSFSVPHGFYSGPIQVEILNDTPGVQIYYTLNGTEPYLRNPTTGAVTPNGTLYSGPLTINSTTTLRAAALFPGQEPSKVATATYLFLSDILTQPATAPGPGWPTAAVNGQVIRYGMDSRIVNDPVWGPQMSAAFAQIPSMSIATDIGNLFNASTGIYVNADIRGIAWERPISLEMIVPNGYTDPVDPDADQADGFQVNAGLRIRGGFSRTDGNPKHAFRLFFRGEYGDSKLNFPLFGDEGVDEFDKFDLRTSQNYSWAFQNDARNTMLRDEVSRVLIGDMDQLYTRGRYYHLFINGTYWGLFQSEERPDADYAASYIGGNEENFDVLKNENPGGQGSGRSVGVSDGNTDAYMRLWNMFIQPGGLGDANMDDYFRAQGMNPDGTRNAAFERLLDVDSVIDHMILTYYTNASDAAGSKFTRPGLNNWFTIYDRTNPDGFQHIVHDFEHAFDAPGASGAFNMVVPFVNNCGNFSTFNPHCQHELLMETNGVYAQQFVDRVYELFFDDGVLSTNHVIQRIDELASQIDVAMIAESARWGNSRNPPYNLTDWQNAVATMKAWVTTTRSGAGGIGRVWEVIDQLRAVGWVPQVGPPIITPDGGRVDENTEVTLSVPGTTLFNDTTIVSGVNGQTVAKYLVPTNNAVDGVWYTTAFNDSSWASGALGIAYKDNNGALDNPNITSTNVGSPAGGADVPVYVRVPFTMTSTDVDELILRMNYDDAFVAYLNGVEVARRNFTGTPTFSSLAGGVHNADPGGTFEDIDISSFKDLLVSGNNLLAVHAINGSGSSDLFIQPALVSRTSTMLDAAGQIYYTTDGSDPRGPDGNPGPTATSYNRVEDYLTPASTGTYLVATGSGESGWQNIGFNDTGWSPAATSVGFDTGASEIIGGFAVRVVDTTSGDIADGTIATNLLNGNTTGFVIGSDITRSQPHVDYGAGNFANDLPLFGTADAEQYAIRATSNVTIPVGTWTINVGSDDGFRLTIPGVSFTAKYNTNGDPGLNTNTLVYNIPRGHGNTGGTFTVSGSALTTTITLDFYERGGGDSVELSIASGAQGAFAVGPFSILRDGQNTWSVKTLGENVNYDPLVQTDVQAAMLNQGSSLYLRYPFTVAGVADIQNLSMAATYDDGFVAYLNGVQVASRAAPASPTHTSVATTVRSDQASIVKEFIDLAAFTDLLVVGPNVLAVHVLNGSSSNPDLLMKVELDGTFAGESFTLTDNTLVKARALLNGEWSAISQSFFLFGEASLAVSEINYHPAPPTAAEQAAGISDADDFEFIELVNIGTRNVNLVGVEFTGGIRFDFTQSPVQVLPPGERVVIVRNLIGFNARYGATLPGGTRIAGVYSGGLSNGGESLTLADGLGGIVQTFSFQDDWHAITDGGGFTLNIRDVYGDPTNWDQRSGWRPSSATGGTPGADDSFSVPDSGDIIVNELLAATDAASRRIELLNTTLAPIDISGWYLSDDPANVTKYQLPAMALLAPGEYRVLNEIDTFGSIFSLADAGGMLVMHATDGGMNLAGFAIHRDYGASQPGGPR